MAFEHEGWGWATPLERSPKVVLLNLIFHADKNGECFPSAALIAHETGLSGRTVRRAIQDLNRLGYIDVRGQKKNGLQTSNRYRLNVGHLHEEVKPFRTDTMSGVTQCHTEKDESPAHSALTPRHPMTPCHPGVSQCHTNQPVNLLNPDYEDSSQSNETLEDLEAQMNEDEVFQKSTRKSVRDELFAAAHEVGRKSRGVA